MNTLRFQACQQLDLLQADGDAAITGWEQPAIELVVDGDAQECQVEQQASALVVRSRAALALRVPQDITLHIGRASEELILRGLAGVVTADTVHGDLSIGTCSAEIVVHHAQENVVAEQLAGTLAIGAAHGDVHLHSVSAVRLGHVDGAVYARAIDGALEMGVVQGDVQARQVAGSLALETGQGDFRGQDLQGGMHLRQIKGDLVLRTGAAPTQTYRAQVDGAITAWFPVETSARFVLKAQGSISATLPQIESEEPRRTVGQAGAGEATIELEAGEDIFVQVQGHQDRELDAWAAVDSISSQIEAEMTQHLGSMHVDAMAQREIDKALRKVELEISKAQREMELERLRAQENARRAQERAARAARRAQAKIALKSRHWGVPGEVSLSLFGPTPAPLSPSSTDRRPSRDEQLAILEMLQQKKITVAEAEALLAALGD